MSTVPSRSDSALSGDVREAANEYIELARAKAEEFTETTEKLIRNRPAQALCVAAGIGFVLGACWMRRR